MPFDTQDLVIAPPLRIHFSPGEARTLVVCFAGVGTVRHAPPAIELAGSATADGLYPALFVTDESRSWLNAPGMAERIVAEIRQTATRLAATRIVGLGNSMGASMALHLSGMLDFDTVLALTPQYSANPAVMPEERRWSYFRKRIAQFRFDRIDALRPERTRYVIVHGDGQDELAHALRFPRLPGVAHFIVPGMDHRLSASLKARGVLRPLVRAAIEGRGPRIRRLIEGEGGMFRSAFEAGRQERAVRG